jgi:putative peptidoglycan lipid II flippase
MVKASLLGTSALSDAFSVSYMLPNLFRRLFAEGSIAAAFIPTFKEYLTRSQDREAEIRSFLSGILSILTFLVSLAVGLGILAAPILVLWFRLEDYRETIFLTRLMFPFLAFISLAALFQGILNSLYIFAPSGMAPIVLNLATIGCAYGLSPYTANPARSMAWGILLGGLLEAAIQLPFVIRAAPRFGFTSLTRAFKHPGCRKTLRLIGPTVIGMAAYQLNDLVSTMLAGYAGRGAVSSLQYSLRIQELILGIFAVSLGTVLLPDLAEDAKTGRWERYNERLTTALNIIILITIPVTFFFLSQGRLLIRLLFQDRLFDEESVRLTYSAFRFHICGLLFIAVNRILAPAFYAQGDSASPTLAGIISFGVNMLLAALLAGPLRGAGIALALSLAGAVNTALLLWFLRRNHRIALGGILRSSLGYTLKLTAFSVAAAAPVLLLRSRLNALTFGSGRVAAYGAPFALSALIFSAAGIALLALSKDKQFRALLNLLKKPG